MEHSFSGVVTAVQDKSGVSKKDGSPFISFAFRVEELNPAKPEYPEAMAFEIFGDKVQCPKQGDNVTVDYNVKSNVWEGKIFGSNQAWKIAVNGSGAGQPSRAAQQAGYAASQDDTGDMPF